MKFFERCSRFLTLAVFIVGVFALMIPTAARTAELVVIRSDAPGFSAGQIIADGQGMDIPEGKAVTLISGSGLPVNLAGPFSGIPAASAAKGDSGLAEALSSIVTSRKDASPDMGATRAAARSVGGTAGLWQLNATKSGTTCLLRNKTIKLWRPGTKAGAKLEIKNAESSQAAKLVWPKDRDTAGWPGALSLEDGGKYLIRLAGEKVPIVLEIKMIDAPSGNLGEKAVMLAKKGCNGQASSLLMSVK